MYWGVLLVCMLWLMSGCSVKEKVATSTTETVTETLSNADYIEKIVGLLKKDGIIINEPVWELTDIETSEYYGKVQNMVAFDIEEEQENESTSSNGPSNKMRRGYILGFASAADMTEMIDAQMSRWYVDAMGMDSNFISPLFFSNNERFIVLQLNSQIAESKVAQFEALLPLMGESPTELTNWQLVESMTGEWSGDEGLTNIRLEKGKLRFGKRQLTIIGTDDKNRKIHTREVTNEKSSYVFLLTDKGMTVLPSLSLEQRDNQSVKGGDLAPMDMIRSNDGLTIEKIAGNWQSVESDYPGVIQFKTTNSPHEMDVLISSNEKEAGESIRLTAESYGGANDFIDFVNEDKTMWYNLSYYENDQWSFSSGTLLPEADGMGRPYIIKRVE